MITIDVPRMLIHKDGREIKCHSPQHFRMLIYLANADGMIKTRQDIIHNCWESKVVELRNVDVALTKIRKLIGDPHPGKIIQTVVGMGIKVVPGKVKILGQNGASSKYEGYVLMKYAKLKDTTETLAILKHIKNEDEWIAVPKSEYEV